MALTMKYFVLKPKGKDKYAEASRAALQVYAQFIDGEDHELACELWDWAEREAGEIDEDGK